MRGVRDADLLIVGGGPAGLATAIAAHLAGFRALVVEGRKAPIDKACGEGIMPDGVARLRSLGVDLSGSPSAPFRGIRYLEGATVAEAPFPGDPGLGVRRPVLHQALARRAQELGVECRWGVRALGLTAHGVGVETTAGRLRGRWVVGADGLHSRVRRWAGLEARPPGLRRFGLRRHYALSPWSDLVEVHWGEGCEAYVTPVGPGEVGVAMLWSGDRAPFNGFLARFPSLAQGLAHAPVTSRDLGAGPLWQRVRGVGQGPVVLVGDASGYIDALTGEGLALAFHQATALVKALELGDLAFYERAHRRIGRVANALTRLLLAAEGRPWLRRRLVPTLATEPGLFSRFLALHSRALPPRKLGWVAPLRLAWRLLAHSG